MFSKVIKIGPGHPLFEALMQASKETSAEPEEEINCDDCDCVEPDEPDDFLAMLNAALSGRTQPEVPQSREDYVVLATPNSFGGSTGRSVHPDVKALVDELLESVSQYRNKVGRIDTMITGISTAIRGCNV